MDKQLTYFDQLFVGRRRGYTAGVGCVNINDEGISVFYQGLGIINRPSHVILCRQNSQTMSFAGLTYV